MKVVQHVCRRRNAVLILIFLLVTCVVAEEGKLLVIVRDVGKHPFRDVKIGLEGGGGSPGTTDENGKARLTLAPGTKPASWVELYIDAAPEGLDLVIESPEDGRTMVPPWENENENYVKVKVTRRGSNAMLETADGALALQAAKARAASAAVPKKKPTNPSSQNYRHRPATAAFNSPYLQTVSLREIISPLDYAGPACPDDEIQQAALAAAARKFGLSVKDVKDALAAWGGDDVVWGEIMLTASIVAGGADPFSFVRAANQDIQFGAGAWSLRVCDLQPVLLQFQQRNPKRFAEIMGADTQWLSETMGSSCQASTQAALHRMLDNSGRLSAQWRSRFEDLGEEPSFQHVQVEQLQLDVNRARTLAATLGLQSDQATAFLAAPAVRSVLSATPTLRENYQQGVASLTQRNGRAPDERSRLLVLKDRTIESWKGQTETSPEAKSNFISLVNLLSDGTGMVSGRQYDLDEFGIGPNSPKSCSESKAPGPTPWGSCTYNVFDPAGEKQLVDLMNQERKKQGTPALEVDARLNQAARKHTANVVQHHSLTHQIGDEPPMAVRIRNENFPSDQEAENISVAPNVAAVHRTMMNSSDHRTNILNPDYDVVGVGAVQCGGALWVTLDFAHRLPEGSQAQADALLQEAINKSAQAQGMPPPLRKPQAQLQSIACEMARSGAVNREAPAQLPGVIGVLPWRTGDPAELPIHVETRLSKPMPGGYSLGVCLAPNVGNVGEIYWVVMVTY
jgi:uncharacterized protein YkwD